MLSILHLISLCATLLPRPDKTPGAYAPAAFGDVVITEVMANPKYAAALPEAEYIEILNRTQRPLSTAGWVMGYGTSVYQLPHSTIAPGQYVILTHERHAAEWEACGVDSRMDMARFPTIANESERYFFIADSCSTLLAWHLFSPDCITDDFKRKGGFSVELTDTSLAESPRSAHKASCDRRGGTPGEPNSVQEECGETFAPSLTSAALTPEGKVRLTFNAPASAATLTDRHSYTAGGIAPAQVTTETSGPLCTEAEIDMQLPYGENVITLQGLATPGGTPFAVPESITLTPGTAPAPGDIAVTEIMFKANDTAPEYIELHNTTGTHISLDALWVEAAGADRTYKSPVQVSAHPLQIAPQAYVCLTAKPQQVTDRYGTPPWNIVAVKLPSLSNDGGYIRLSLASAGTVEEAMFSNDSYPASMKDLKGVSLERISTALDPMSPQSWLPAAQSAGYGTPAAPNSQHYEGGAPAQGSFTPSTDVFTPDGSGSHTFLAIDYSLPGTGYTADVTVFDSRGTAVRHVARRELLPQQGTLVWNGQDDSGSNVPRGIYVVVIKADGPQGDVKGDRIAVAVN